MIAIIIPAYNEAKRIGVVLEELAKLKLPIFVVDDGSKDSTFEAAQGFNATLLKHKINLGKGASLKTGCSAAFELGAEAVVIMDADGQHKTADLPKFLTALQEGKYDIIFGSRNLRMGMPIIRFMGNKFASTLINLLFGIYISDLLCGYRAFTKDAFKKINWESSGYGIETEMVINTGRKGLRYCEVPVETVYYDKFKGVTILDALGILGSVIKWRIFR